jgi:hypothetical protein
MLCREKIVVCSENNTKPVSRCRHSAVLLHVKEDGSVVTSVLAEKHCAHSDPVMLRSVTCYCVHLSLG